MAQTVKTVILSTLLMLSAAPSCTPANKSEIAGQHKACYLPADKRCVEATGDNPGFADGGCAGETYESCPTTDRVASCVIKENTKNEATIRYYGGFEADGKTDCDTAQSVHDGQYYPED